MNELDNIQMRDQDDEVEIDLIELMYYFWGRLPWIIAAFAVGAVALFLITFFLITPKYTAESKIYMVSAASDSIVDLTDLNLGTSLSSDYEEVLKSRPIFEDVIEDLDLEYDYDELMDMVEISTVQDTRILQVSAESPDPEEAMDIANALADQAVEKLPDLMDTSKPNIVEQAIVPDEPSSPSYALNIMLGALAATLAALGILTMRFVMDDTLKTAEDVEDAFGILPLTVIPEGDLGMLSEEHEKKSRKQKSKSRIAGRRRKS